MIVQRLALAFGSFVLVCLALEGFVRINYRNELDVAVLRAALAETKLAAYTRPSVNPELLYELRPDVALVGWGGIRLKTDPDEWCGIRLTTDSDGWCRIAPSRAGEPETAGFRIAILGDSSSFGWKIPFELSYGEILRFLLERSLHTTLGARGSVLTKFRG